MWDNTSGNWEKNIEKLKDIENPLQHEQIHKGEHKSVFSPPKSELEDSFTSETPFNRSSASAQGMQERKRTMTENM